MNKWLQILIAVTCVAILYQFHPDFTGFVIVIFIIGGITLGVIKASWYFRDKIINFIISLFGGAIFIGLLVLYVFALIFFGVILCYLLHQVLMFFIHSDSFIDKSNTISDVVAVFMTLFVFMKTARIAFKCMVFASNKIHEKNINSD